MGLFKRGDRITISQSFDANLDGSEGYVRDRWNGNMRDDGRVNRVEVAGTDQFGNDNPVYMFLDGELVLCEDNE